MRERRPGVWEIRVAAGVDPVTSRMIQRSVTFHGAAAEAEDYRRDLAAEYAARRSIAQAAPLLTVAELLERWLAADHPWKPSTRIGYTSNARFLSTDPMLGARRVVSLTPDLVNAASRRWTSAGASISVTSGRFRVLRAAIGWAYDERIIDHHPVRHMRGPGRPEPRRPLTDVELAALLITAEHHLLEAFANTSEGSGSRLARHRCEQDLLLVRLAADCGARRGRARGAAFRRSRRSCPAAVPRRVR